MIGRERAGVAGVLVAADGSPWEPGALEAIAGAPDLVMLRRCLDLHDLMAVAATGTARVAVVAAPAPGVDRDLVDRLSAAGVAVVAVVARSGTTAESYLDLVARLEDLGVGAVVEAESVATGLPGVVRESLSARPGEEPAVATGAQRSPAASPTGVPDEQPGVGRVVAVWGPTGAPGRSTVATGVAAGLAGSGRHTLLLDADPYGGTVAQQLGILDDASGLLAAARHANAGTLTTDRLRAATRSLDTGLTVLTGLPRPDRWRELAPRNLAEVVRLSAEEHEAVVVDCGFGGEHHGPSGATSRSRDALVSTLVRDADVCIVVGSADPVGLTRLARLLVDGRQLRPQGPDHVVINRMRPGLGWREHQLVDMVARLSPDAQVHFLPLDVASSDRAAQEGRSVVELGADPLASAVGRVVDAVAGVSAAMTRVGRRSRPANKASPVRPAHTLSSR